MKLDQPSKAVCNIVDERDCRRCVKCGISLYIARGARHHRKLRSHAFGSEKHSPCNLILLCEDCHGWVHAHPREAREHGWIVSSYQTPTEVAIDTSQYGRVLLLNEGTVTPLQMEEEE